MIKGLHAMFYSTAPEETRAFLRDVLEFPFSDTDGKGWLIFDVPEADIGVHPPEGTAMCDISFYCEDLDATMSNLREKHVQFSEVRDAGWGRVTDFKMPGGIVASLYQPRYQK